MDKIKKMGSTYWLSVLRFILASILLLLHFPMNVRHKPWNLYILEGLLQINGKKKHKKKNLNFSKRLCIVFYFI